MPSLDALQTRLGHVFRTPGLLREAITHPSYGNEHPTEGPHNQRLEFLGDAVLQIIVTEALYALHPEAAEGVLSRYRAVLTKGRCLAQLAMEIGLDRALRLGGSEETSGGRTRPSNLEDAFEAVVGALHQDAGLESTRAIVLRIYGPLPPRLALGVNDNPKGRLQEHTQPTHGTTPLRYATRQIAGPDHAREFEAEVYLGERLLGSGRGPSKKAAEEAAARVALAALESGPA